MKSEARVSPNLWKGLVRKMRRHKVSRFNAKPFLYAKLTDTIPKYDPNLTQEERDKLQEDMEKIFNQIRMAKEVHDLVHGDDAEADAWRTDWDREDRMRDEAYDPSPAASKDNYDVTIYG